LTKIEEECVCNFQSNMYESEKNKAIVDGATANLIIFLVIYLSCKAFSDKKDALL